MFDEMVRLYNETAMAHAELMYGYGANAEAAEMLARTMEGLEKFLTENSHDIPWIMTYSRRYINGYGYASVNYAKRM